jgi:hypothetical protein
MSFNLDEGEPVDIHDLIVLVEPSESLARKFADMENWRGEIATSLGWFVKNDDPRPV